MDDKLISQVFINILKNAYETLINDEENISPTLSVRLLKGEYSISVEIANNGKEIPAELREQIFIPFFTTKEEGTGIGLSLSKQIMLKMNGDILLNSTKENLTKFIISFN